MSSVRIAGDTSGTVTLQAPAIAGNPIITLPTTSGTLITDGVGQTFTTAQLVNPTITGAIFSNNGSSIITSGTAQASTSGASINFTGLPSWVKRITVMLSGVSTNGTSNLLVQLGDAGGIETSGYNGAVGNRSSETQFSAGFILTQSNSAALLFNGNCVINNLSSNTWVESSLIGVNGAASAGSFGAGSKSLSDTLTQLRITTVNGTDIFDAGSINILYE